MKRISKKGFSLIEVIAAVVIMGILMSTVIVSVSKHLKKSHSNYCSQQVDMMIVAGRDYFNDNKSRLPLEIGKEECVSLDFLTTNKYIESMKDYSGSLCNTTNSKVCAMKTTASSYYYSGVLDCGKCSLNNNRDNNDAVPTIEFYPNSANTKNKDIVVEMRVSDKNSEIVSYAYTVYEKKDDGSSVAVKQIDFREYDGKKIEIKLNRKGTFYIEGYAYNSVGKRGYKKSGDYKLDFDLDCEKSIEISAHNGNKVLNEKTWVNGAISIDINASGAVSMYNVFVSMDGGNNWEASLSRVFGTNRLSYNDQRTGKYMIKVVAYDGYGNSCDTVPVVYYQDNKAPDCTTDVVYKDNNSAYDNKWTNRNLILKPVCSDSDSGCAEDKNSGKELNASLVGMISAGTVYDNAGNFSQCSGVDIKIDKDKPSCNITLNGTKGDNGYYTSEAVVANLEASDLDNQQIVSYSFSTESNSSLEDIVGVGNRLSKSLNYTTQINTNTKYYAKVVDAAGNSSECTSPNFKLDSIKPNCEFNVSGESTDWKSIDDKPVVKLKCNDGNGSGCVKTDYGDLLDKSSLANKSMKTKEFKETIKDKAGNSRECNRNVNVYIDNKKPSCGVWKGNKTWTNSDVEIGISCNDSDSGCKKAEFSKTYKDSNEEIDTKNVKITICDKLDNCRDCSTNSNTATNKGVCDSNNCKDGELYIRHDTKAPLIPYFDNSEVKKLDGKDVLVNIYGNCDSDCVKADPNGRVLSASLQSAGNKCFTNRSCVDIKNSSGSVVKKVCSHIKHYVCGGFKVISKDTGSGVKDIRNTSTTGFGCIHDNKYDVDILTYVAEDYSGNISKPLYVEVLNQHLYPNASDNRKLTDYYERSSSNPSWSVKNKTCPEGTPAFKDR